MTSVYDWVSKTYTGPQALGYSLFIASATCLFSIICASILALLDFRRTRIIPQEPVQAGDEIKLTDALHFPFTLWLVFIICVCFYSAVFPFISLGKVFFISKFDFAPTSANTADRFTSSTVSFLWSWFFNPNHTILVLFIWCLRSARLYVAFWLILRDTIHYGLMAPF